jgi:hypothetical protein
MIAVGVLTGSRSSTDSGADNHRPFGQKKRTIIPNDPWCTGRHE